MAITGIRYQIISIAWQVPVSISSDKHESIGVKYQVIKMVSNSVRYQVLSMAWQVSGVYILGSGN